MIGPCKARRHFLDLTLTREQGLIENWAATQVAVIDRFSPQEQFSMRVFGVKPAPPLGLV